MTKVRTTTGRRARRAAAAFGLGAAVVLLTVAPAEAKTYQAPKYAGVLFAPVNCTLSGTLKFAPALKTKGGGTGRSSVKGVLSNCTSTDSVLKILSGELTGSFTKSPLTCAGLASANASGSFTVKWKGTVNGLVNGTTFAGSASITPSTLSSTGEDVVANDAGDEGFSVPGSSGSASVTGASKSWTSSIFSTDTSSALTTACGGKGIKSLTVTGPITVPVVATQLQVSLPSVDVTPSAIDPSGTVPSETLTVSAVDPFGNVDPTITGLASITWMAPPTFTETDGTTYYWQVNPGSRTPVEPTSVALADGTGSVSGVVAPMWGPLAFCDYGGTFADCDGLTVWPVVGFPPTTVDAQIDALTGSVQQSLTFGNWNVTGYSNPDASPIAGEPTYSAQGTATGTSVTVTAPGGGSQVVTIPSQPVEVQSATANPDGTTSVTLDLQSVTATLIMSTPIVPTTNTVAPPLSAGQTITVSPCVGGGVSCLAATYNTVKVISGAPPPPPVDADFYTQLVNILGGL